MREIRTFASWSLITGFIVGAVHAQSVYQETGGLVVMEAERASLVEAWVSRPSTPVSDPSMSGSLGDGWLEWTGSQYSGNTINEGAAHGVLSYRFQITTEGDYTFRWRSKQYNAGQAGDAGNDTFVRFASGTVPPGAYDFSSFSKVWVQSKAAWSWTTTFEPSHGTHYGSGQARRHYTAGIHEIQFAARSPGHSIDRMVLHHSSVPFNASSFESAPESPTSGGPPYAYQAISDFPILNAGEVPYYVDGGRSALAIDAANVSYRGKFARAVRTFDDIPGTYTATITALQELDGECVYRLLVNDVVVGTATNSPTTTDYSEQNHVFRDVVIPAGATLAVESKTDSNGQIPEGSGFAWARGRWRSLTLSASVNGPAGPVSIPGLIEAEDYMFGGEGVGYHDTTSGNAGTAYRSDGVDIEETGDVGGGFNVGWTTAGEWLAYEIEVPDRGYYDVNLRVAAQNEGGAFALQVNGTDVSGVIPVPSTTGWQTYTDVLVPNVGFASSATELRLVIMAGGFNINSLEVRPALGFPQVSVGADQFVFLPTNSVILNGSVSDNGSITSTTWTQQSGPDATLAGTNTSTLTASDLVQGTYVFRLTAVDNELNTSFDEATVYVLPEGSGQAILTGELMTWHKITLSFAGPATSETATPNPFADYRLDVTFTHPDSGASYQVPGYYAADGNAADSSAAAGNVWRTHFAPDADGIWTYSASFRTGTDVAVAANPASGTSAGFFDGDSGSFAIVPTNKSGRDHRGKGRLQYVNKHHLRFAGTGEYFLKAGADAPENFLAYADFDNTPNVGGRRKSWNPHAGDYDAADAVPHTWQTGKGTEMLGAVRYLANKGMNAFSFLTFSLAGDDDNVFPHLLKVAMGTYEGYGDDNRWNQGVHKDRFDVSKMDQWERIFEYADKKGMYLHFKTQETENDQRMDGGNVGRERKLYYRELIARYAHHLALNWNGGEENTNTEQQRKDIAQYFYDTDPYRHNVVLHTYPGDKNSVYPGLLGSASKYTGASLQSNPSSVFSDTKKWRNDSASAGKPWVVANDEQGSANIGIDCDSADYSHNSHRKDVLWGNIMAGGAGVEAYFGYQTCSTDLDCQDYRTRDNWWNQCAHALLFFTGNAIPFWDMSNQDNLVSTGHCLAGSGAYVVYLPSGGSPTLNLGGTVGAFLVRWFDPRNGGALQLGSVPTVSGGSVVSLGSAPGASSSDWAVLVTPGDPGQNFPPLVDAGDDQAQVLESRELLSVVLDGSAIDDGLPTNGVLTTTWSLVSGPSTVEFGDATLPHTIATFHAQGTYVLALAASDGELTASNTVTVSLGDSVGGDEVSIEPSDDAYLQGAAETLFNNGDLRVEANNRVSYLKFPVTGSTGLAGATLILTEGSDTGNGTINVHAGSHNNWTETTLSGATKPAKQGGALDTFSGTVSNGMEVDFDVSSFVTANGTYSFVVEHTSGNDVSFASKESGAAAAPQLVLSLPNTPPTCSIPPPTNGTMYVEDRPFEFSATASDPEGSIASMELFVNGLSMGSRPGGANTWTVSGLSSGSHHFVVVTSDAAGTIASSSTMITVDPSNFIVDMGLIPEGMVLTWPTIPGMPYGVYYKSDSSDPTWVALGNGIEAPGNQLSVTNDPGAALQRFYRVEELHAPAPGGGQITFDDFAASAHNTHVPTGTAITAGLPAGLTATVGGDANGFGVNVNGASPADVAVPTLFVFGDGATGASLQFSAPVAVPSLWTSAPSWALANDPSGEQRITGKLGGATVWSYVNTAASTDYFEITEGAGTTIDELVVYPKWVGVDNIQIQ